MRMPRYIQTFAVMAALCPFALFAQPASIAQGAVTQEAPVPSESVPPESAPSAPVPSAPVPIASTSFGSPAIPGDTYWSQVSPHSADQPDLGPPPGEAGVLSSAVAASVRSAKQAVSPIRASAIETAAKTYSVQAGLASRSWYINQSLYQRAAKYDLVFNFSAVMLEPGFIPPVIEEGRDAYNQPSATVVRAADRLYRIEFPARLVSSAPTWRDYLPLAVVRPSLPDAAYLPHTPAERAVWDAAAAQGWKQGVVLADQTFEGNLARLSRDFTGMLRYKALYQQGVVAKPILAKSNLGVTGGGDEMAINDRVYEVTRSAALDPDRSRWLYLVPKTAPADNGQQDPIDSATDRDMHDAGLDRFKTSTQDPTISPDADDQTSHTDGHGN